MLILPCIGTGARITPPAEGLPDRLMAKADAEQRDSALGRGGDGVEADAGPVGIAGAGRQHDAIGTQIKRLCHRQCVITFHHDFRAQFAEEMDEVVGETVIVIDQQQHAATRGKQMGNKRAVTLQGEARKFQRGDEYRMA